ncbi:MAG: response regulator [Acidobacteria bacterium]|nr:response regulator [Acidobacteriota bacterium]
MDETCSSDRTADSPDTTEETLPDSSFQLSNEWLGAILASAMDAIITIDDQHRVVLFNRAAEKMFQYKGVDILGGSLDRFLPVRFRAAHHDHISQFGQTQVSQRQMGPISPLSGLRSNGEEFPIEASISQIQVEGRRLFTVIIRDITEKRRLESQLLRAQRLESIGTLAGGIAHDLNNVLSPILTATELLQMRATDESSLRLLNIIQTNAVRGGEMIRQVLSFARGVEGDYKLLQPNHLIREIVKILTDIFPKNIEISFSLNPNLWFVNGDATQLHQVLMNLCVNARDAMPEGGKLWIEAENIAMDQRATMINVDARPGRYVRLLVQDSGCGISPDVVDKIFDPFFTTKMPGQGTGLGLSTVAGILRSHGGFVNVYSEPGKGTHFSVYLPASQNQDSIDSATVITDLPRGNGELILVVDDERSILEVATETLTAFGYNVVTAADGVEAVASFAANADRVKLVLTDMMMPLMDGAATIRALQKLDPSVRIIATSGLKADSRHAEITQLGVRNFLPKPYSAETLLRLVSRVLVGNADLSEE